MSGSRVILAEFTTPSSRKSEPPFVAISILGVLFSFESKALLS